MFSPLFAARSPKLLCWTPHVFEQGWMYDSLSGRSHSPTEGGATSLAEVAVLPTVRASRCANLQSLQTDVFMQLWLQKKKKK